jgi:tRNA(fMet)-specific endonuclease VapC
MGFLLDTNILSDLIRNPQGRVAARIRAVGETQVCTSIIVAAELRYGAAKKGSVRLTAQLDTILATVEILAFDEAADLCTANFAATSKGLGSRSAETTCCSLPTRSHSGTRWSQTTNGNLPESTPSNGRIGCVRHGLRVERTARSCGDISSPGWSVRRPGRR